MSGLDPRQLTLELTETTLLRNVAASTARLKMLKSIGVRIAIDDFGTGYSSMAYLQQLPVDVLKLDGSFIAHIADSTESRALVHTLIQLGKVLEISTTGGRHRNRLPEDMAPVRRRRERPGVPVRQAAHRPGACPNS